LLTDHSDTATTACPTRRRSTYTFAGQRVYVRYSQWHVTSRLVGKFSAIIGVGSKVRNIRTVEELLATR
jgi:hypothetical protein